jgi:MFS family permease
VAVRHCCRSARKQAAQALEELLMNTRSPSAVTAVRPRWVLGLTSIAYFMVVLDSLVVVTALPRMQQDLQAGLADLQWTVNSYGIAFAAGIITAAALGDRFGRRRIFTFGLVLFTLSSAACALAPDAAGLIVARTVQGLGAAAVLPLSLTILTTAFPPQRRGLIIGIYGGLAGLAVAAGPLVGGAVTEGLNWHWIFWLNVPVGLIAATLGTRLLPESHGAAHRLDLLGVVLVTGGVVALVWALVRAGDAGWSGWPTVGTLLAGCVLLLAFAWWQRRAHAPLMPMALFRSPAFSAGTVTMFLMSGATFAAAFWITQDFQFARGYSPISTGLRLLPFFATPMVISPFAGAVSDRIGRRPIMVTAYQLGGAGHRVAGRRRRDLDGAAHRACRRPERGPPGAPGQSLRDQLHGPASRHRVRRRDRHRRVLRLRPPRRSRRRHRRVPARPVGQRRLRRAGRGHGAGRLRTRSPVHYRYSAGRRPHRGLNRREPQCLTSCTASASTPRRTGYTT